MDNGKKRPAAGLAALLLLATVPLLTPGCGEKAESSVASLDAAVVPGADFSGRIDYRTARKSPAVNTILRLREEKSPVAARADEEQAREFEAAAGFSRDDLLTVLFSGDVDGVDPGNPGKGESYREMNAVLAFAFDRALSREQLDAGLRALFTEDSQSRVEEGEVAGRKVFTVTNDGYSGPMLYAALSRDGRTIFFTPNAPSMEKVCSREEERRVEELPASLERVERFLPPKSQLKTSFVVPEPMRLKIEEELSSLEKDASKNPGMGMALGLMAPFRKISSLSLGVNFGEGLDFGLSADLEGEGEALQAATIVQTILLPLLKAKLSQQGGAAIDGIEEKISVSSSGPNLHFTVSLDPADLEALQL